MICLGVDFFPVCGLLRLFKSVRFMSFAKVGKFLAIISLNRNVEISIIVRYVPKDLITFLGEGSIFSLLFRLGKFTDFVVFTMELIQKV